MSGYFYACYLSVDFCVTDYALSTESNQYSVTPGIDAGIFVDTEKLPPKSGDMAQYVVVHYNEGEGSFPSPSTTLCLPPYRPPKIWHCERFKKQEPLI